jgi:hypothetical protein
MEDVNAVVTGDALLSSRANICMRVSFKFVLHPFQSIVLVAELLPDCRGAQSAPLR